MVSKKISPNPAIRSKRRTGDSASLISTFDEKGTSKAILQAIKRSESHRALTEEDYTREISAGMSAQVPQVDRLIYTTNDVASEIEDAYKELEGNHKMPTVKEAVNSFTAALIEYRDAILIDLVASSIASAGDNSGKVRKTTEWGSKKPWKKSAPLVGESMKFSAVPEQEEGIEQKFEDESAEEAKLEQPEPEAPKETKPKKKRTVKKVLKKVAKHPEQSEPGRKTETAAGSRT